MYKIDKNKCADCGYCAYVCPFGAIIHHLEDKFYEIDQDKCKHCGLCFKSCIGGFISKDPGDLAIAKIEIGPECIGCTNCARNCPASAVVGALKEKHHIDESKCIKCGFCATKCPKKCIKVNYAK